MSDLYQIHTALQRRFNEEGLRIVFRNGAGTPTRNLLEIGLPIPYP